MIDSIASMFSSIFNLHDSWGFTSFTVDNNVVTILVVTIICTMITIICCLLLCLFCSYRRSRIIAERTDVADVRYIGGGLSPNAITALPTFLYEKTCVDNEEVMENFGSRCPICLSFKGEGDIMRQLPKCNHAFHIWCIDEWFSAHSTCPYCRTDAMA